MLLREGFACENRARERTRKGRHLVTQKRANASRRGRAAESSGGRVVRKGFFASLGLKTEYKTRPQLVFRKQVCIIAEEVSR